METHSQNEIHLTSLYKRVNKICDYVFLTENLSDRLNIICNGMSMLLTIHVFMTMSGQTRLVMLLSQDTDCGIMMER